MPGAGDHVVFKLAFGQRSAHMGTGGGQGVDLPVATDQQHINIVDIDVMQLPFNQMVFGHDRQEVVGKLFAGWVVDADLLVVDKFSAEVGGEEDGPPSQESDDLSSLAVTILSQEPGTEIEGGRAAV